MFLMPVMPFLTDSFEMIDGMLEAAGEAGVDFVLFSGLTLREGRQRAHLEYFLEKEDHSGDPGAGDGLLS